MTAPMQWQSVQTTVLGSSVLDSSMPSAGRILAMASVLQTSSGEAETSLIAVQLRDVAIKSVLGNVSVLKGSDPHRAPKAYRSRHVGSSSNQGAFFLRHPLTVTRSRARKACTAESDVIERECSVHGRETATS